MKRLAERVLLGGFLNGLIVLASASCSSTSSPPTGSGNNTGTGGSSANHGGSSSGGTGGSAVGVGGNGTPQGGTSTGSGGSGTFAGSAGVTSVGGSGGAVATCSTDPNLVNATGCFVGCDPALTTDNPQGLQGALYTFGDGTSCATTMPPTGSGPPCSTKGVCLSGATIVDPLYHAYGCGIGLELNSTGGTTPVKNAYSGAASCFSYTLTGDPGKNEIRVAFTQLADTTGKVSPYKSILPTAWKNGSYSATICMKDVSCNSQMNCMEPGTSAYDLQIEVAGGNPASGPYNICLTSLVPQASGTSTLNPIVGVPGSGQTGPSSMEAVGKYFVQTNINNNPGGSLTVTPTLNGTNAGFTVNSSNLQDPGMSAPPAAYPSIVDGWHYGATSSDTSLPILLSKLATAQSSVTYTGSSGRYDASYDIWVLPSAKPATPSGGLEVMLWLNDAGVQPSGSKVGTFTQPATGATWDVWTNTQSGGWKYVAYVKLNQNTFSGDLAPFIQDAATRQGIPQSDYLAGIQFGFELWQGGNVSVTSFSSAVTSK